MDGVKGRFLMITANIGSLFEEHGKILQENWANAFHKFIEVEQPGFIALHLQEVGGKTHDISRQQVGQFYEILYSPPSFQDYVCVHSYLDEEFHDTVKYTALGCSYFIHRSMIDQIQQWDFQNERFVSLAEERSLDTITEETRFIRKSKFPLSCYSKKATKLPRKGFTWTKWKINNEVFVMLNIHLTHDASNIKITQKNDTKYAKYRKRSLVYALEQIKDITCDNHIIFGDFNVRPDTKALVEHLMGEEIKKDEICSNGKPSTLIYRNTNMNGCSKVLLTVKDRHFEFSDYDVFNHIQSYSGLLKFDKELDWLLENNYSEAPIKFRPTYPHKENPADMGTQSQSFANVRCPSWCDRIILEKKFYTSVKGDDCIYSTFGEDVMMGDHKPVYFSFTYPGCPDGLLAGH